MPEGRVNVTVTDGGRPETVITQHETAAPFTTMPLLTLSQGEIRRNSMLLMVGVESSSMEGVQEVGASVRLVADDASTAVEC